MTATTDGLVKACQIETKRCRAAVAKGSPVDFWRWRLTGLLEKLDSARRIVQSCMDALPPVQVSHIQQISESLARPPEDGAEERSSEPWRYVEEERP